jgi:hypothetical protein
MSGCSSSLKDDSVLDSLSVETASNEMASQFRCGDAEAPYCADDETLVICAQDKAFVGVVNCSAQHWAKVSAFNKLYVEFFVIQMPF